MASALKHASHEIRLNAMLFVAFVSNDLVDKDLIGRIQSVKLCGAVVLVDLVALGWRQVIAQVNIGSQWNVRIGFVTTDPVR